MRELGTELAPLHCLKSDEVGKSAEITIPDVLKKIAHMGVGTVKLYAATLAPFGNNREHDLVVVPECVGVDAIMSTANNSMLVVAVELM